MILMNKSIKIVICLAFILLPIIGGFVFRLCITETKPSLGAYATDELYSFRSAIGRILGPGNATIEDLLGHPSQDAIKPALANLLRKRDFASVADHLMGQDGWGRSYNIDWRTNLFNRPTAMLRANENSLLIWSSGENGINEYGGGDDCYDSADWQLYIECYKQNSRPAYTNDSADNFPLE